MAGYSLEDLLRWMREADIYKVMWGWDAIAAISRDKTNILLLQEYIARFTNDSYFEPVSGEVPVVAGNWQEHFHHFILDAPRLSFENADISNSKAKLTCAILGGTQVTMKYEVNVWLAERVVDIDPLQGPKLFLDLDLINVPGNVESDGRIYLDLQDSDNFRLTTGESENEQAMGGKFFQEKFNELDPDQQIWVMGRIEPGADEVMRPQFFKLRTDASDQASRDPRAPSFGDGAILIFICMVGGKAGATPADDYRYLIPDDAGGDYSATVLFGRERGSLGILLDSVADIINSHDFAYDYDEGGHLISATAKSGLLTVAAWQYPVPVNPIDPNDPVFLVKVEVGEFTLPADSSHPLVIRWNDSELSAVMEWQTRAVVPTTFSAEGHEATTQNVLYVLTLRAAYELVDNGVEPVLLRCTAFSVEKHTEIIEAGKGAGTSDVWKEVFIPIAAGIAYAMFHDVLVRTVIELALRLDFSVAATVDPFIQKHIRLNFGKALEGDIIRAPRDIGFFGRINPTRTSFQISPLQPLMAVGGSQQFSTEPAVNGLIWTVAALPDQIGDIGDINASSGLYQAPAASAIEGRFVRVRVTATDSASGYSSSALVTVLVNELTVNPLIQRCDAGGSVELKAGALGGGELDWEIKNPVEGESGWFDPIELPEGNRRYVAAPAPVEPVKTYVLDEIEVTHTVTGVKKSVWVLASQKAPMLKLKPLTEQTPLPSGQLRLEANLNGHRTAEWSLPMGGPGSITRDEEGYGLYIADPQAVDRFVLIFAKWDTAVIGIVEGHIILPLPLDGFPAELELMKAAPGN
jgi:hypothetical protein